MASCTQVEGLLQAYIDEELPPSERVVLEQHLTECAACKALLAHHQRTAALIFESFQGDRLREDLRAGVLENLPEMRAVSRDMTDVNWRVKHPRNVFRQMARLMPLAVGAVLVVLGVVLRMYWPQAGVSAEAIGVVGQVSGNVRLVEASDVARLAVGVADLVGGEARYETGANSSLLLLLRGRTSVKLGADSRVRLYDERKVGIEKGRVLLDVGKDARLFKAVTPTGEITVFGTMFDVHVGEGMTTVTVARGQVQVENQRSFGVLDPGEQASMETNVGLIELKPVDATQVVSWGDQITVDPDASDVYEALLDTQPELLEIAAEKVFVVDTSGRRGTFSVKSLRFEWNRPAKPSGGFCSYDVYVSNQKLQPLFKGRIDASVVADVERQWFDLEVTEMPVKEAGILHIKVIPDFSTGRTEAELTRVYGVGYN